jgi:DNA repair protein RecO
LKVSSSRHRQVKAVVLKNNRVGELHKGVTLFTASEGLLHAVAHGAYSAKGKLKSSTNPFTCGRFFLYENPVSESVKINDCEVSDYGEALRTDLGKYYTASLWAECVLKAHGGGESSHRLFLLLSDALTLLASCRTERVRALNVQYLWRFVSLLEGRPETEHCFYCSDDLQGPRELYYIFREKSFICRACMEEREEQGAFKISPGGFRYIRTTDKLPLSKTQSVQPDEESIRDLRKLLYALIEEMLEQRLLSVRSSGGIL